MTDKELVDWLRNCSIYEGRAFLRQAADRIEALEAENERLRSVLSGLSSYLGAGLGDDTTTPEQFDQRIRWGIEHQASVYRDRAASIVEECSKRYGMTWGQVKSAIQNDTFFPEPDNSEVERLNSLINATANHWLDLQHDHPIAWEGAVDAAMEAACDEIRRLSAALGEKQ